MNPESILKEMEKNKKNVKVGVATFNTSIPESEIKQGLSVERIIEAIKSASKKELFPSSTNASTSSR